MRLPKELNMPERVDARVYLENHNEEELRRIYRRSSVAYDYALVKAVNKLYTGGYFQFRKDIEAHGWKTICGELE